MLNDAAFHGDWFGDGSSDLLDHGVREQIRTDFVLVRILGSIAGRLPPIREVELLIGLLFLGARGSGGLGLARWPLGGFVICRTATGTQAQGEGGYGGQGRYTPGLSGVFQVVLLCHPGGVCGLWRSAVDAS